MKAKDFFKVLVTNFPYQLTEGQRRWLELVATFVNSDEHLHIFILNGYAGTGKTTLISTLVNSLGRIRQKAVLMAPTGRAAKVMGNYADKMAFTIHRRIYFSARDRDGRMKFTLQKNNYRNTLFIIDEASMIADRDADGSMFDSRSLLEDILRYVYTGHNCKLLLVGDVAQLPPVGADVSPAMQIERLEQTYSLRVDAIELNQVMRQHQDSGILHNATLIRQAIHEQLLDSVQFNVAYSDIVRLTDGYEIQDAVHTAYDEGLNNAVVIVRSNKRANQFNEQIRRGILGFDLQIGSGDHIMIVKNNYHWLKDEPDIGFIANGDIAEILEIFDVEEKYGSVFADVKLRLVDYDSLAPFETVLLLDTLKSESASLTYNESNRLYQAILEDYSYERSKYKRHALVRENRYFNALQVKYAYAMTCHKTQGGQWDHVFIEQPYLPDGESVEYLRWLYTAVTRAQKKLYLIGFNERYFED